jgi:hypothetical protein
MNRATNLTALTSVLCSFLLKRNNVMTVKRPAPIPVILLAAVFSVIYLANPTGGFIEFIPDNMPIIGNLDEAGATMLLMWAVNEFRKHNDKNPDPRDVTPPRA